MEKFHGDVTELFFTKVNPHQSAEFHNWCVKLQEAESLFPGFKGVFLQAPKGTEGHWITLLQFDSIENMENWLQSKERKALLEQPLPWIDTLESNRINASFAGWFSSLGKEAPVPPVWKQTMLVLLVLFPIVMLEFKFLNPLLTGLSLSVATFIGNALSVALIAYPMMPLALKALGWWCVPHPHHAWKTTLLGLLTLIGLYALEVWIFSFNLF